MAQTNLDAIRKKLNQLNTESNKTTSLWKPSAGETVIRIVPYKFIPDNPFIELQFHYDIGGKTYLSPISFGRPDPIEEFAQKLRTNGDKDSYQMSRKMEAKMRTFVPVVVRGEEAQGVKFWGFGKLVYQELMEFYLDSDYGDISDPMSGRDITVKFIPKEESGASFPKTTIRVKPNQTPLSENKAILDRLLNTQKDIKEVYQELSYDDMRTALENYLNPDEGDSTSSVKEEKTPVANTAITSSATEADFDDLFNK